VAYLVAKGVDVDIFDTNGLTPLMWAVLRSQGPDTIRVLLALGADATLTDRRLRNTPLHLAVETPNATAFDLLLERTKDLQAENNKGKFKLPGVLDVYFCYVGATFLFKFGAFFFNLS